MLLTSAVLHVRGAAEAGPGADRAALLQARVVEAEGRPDGALARPAMQKASAALDQAADADDPEEEARLLEIAHASIVLGEKQLERRALQSELIETQRRITETRERAQAQRRVLEALLEERAALARAGELQ